MKKLFSLMLTLTLTLVLGLSITAFAAPSNTLSVTNGSQNVTGKYVAGAESGTIYGVDISWGSMAFTYTDASKGTWNAETHKYENAAGAAWSYEEGANVITVTNHSNAGIVITPSYTAESAYSAATMSFDKTTLTLDTADNGENGTAGNASSGTITVPPGGSVPAGTNGQIGQITLSIAGTSAPSDGTENSDGKAVITGVKIQVGGITYGRDSTVTLTPNSGDVTFIVTGQNLQNGTIDNNISWKPSHALPVAQGYEFNFSADGTKATRTMKLSRFENVTTLFEIKYANDSSGYIGSGITVIYDNGIPTDQKAVITGVEIQVGGTTYGRNSTVTLTPNSGDVTFIVTGQNLQNGTDDNRISYIPSHAIQVAPNQSFDFSDDGTKATHTMPLSDFEVVTTPFEIKYANDSSGYIGSGITVIYDNGIPTDQKAVITGIEITVGEITYTSGQTVSLNPNSGDVILAVKGTNLQKQTSANRVVYKSGASYQMGSGQSWRVNEEGTSATTVLKPTDFKNVDNGYEIRYSNDGGVNYVGSGVRVSYDTGFSAEEQAVITGVEIKVGETTYGNSQTVTLTPSSGDVTIIVKGKNLQNRTAENRVSCRTGSEYSMAAEGVWNVNEAGTEASGSFSLSDFSDFDRVYEIQYTNDGGVSYIYSGVYITYEKYSDAEKAIITSVEIKVGGVTYKSGDQVTLTPNSGDVIFYVKGTNLQNHTAKNKIGYTENAVCPMGEKYDWEVNSDGTEASKVFWLKEFKSLTEWFEITYTNDSVSYTGSGLYIIYQK